MRSLLAKSVIAAVLGTFALSVAAGAAPKKPEPDNLYVSSWETGNKQFFTVSGWHGTRNYWMAGNRHGHMDKKAAAKDTKAAPKK